MIGRSVRRLLFAIGCLTLLAVPLFGAQKRPQHTRVANCSIQGLRGRGSGALRKPRARRSMPWSCVITTTAPRNRRISASNDVPNNASAPGPDQKRLDLQHDPVFAVAGNCVIIDHGNSEFSVMMHMREGSLVVKVGDQVKQGQLIGRLGNSGDTFGPHLHCQLQSGPELFRNPSIPFTVQNLNRTHLYRGMYFRSNQMRHIGLTAGAS
jgi:hypothetical protein